MYRDAQRLFFALFAVMFFSMHSMASAAVYSSESWQGVYCDKQEKDEGEGEAVEPEPDCD